MTSLKKLFHPFVITLAICRLLHAAPTPVGTAFTYQGTLASGTNAVSGNYDFQLALYDGPVNANQVGTTITATNILVTNGYFSVVLDFGMSSFNGEALWLNVSVQTNGWQQGFTSLSPRQPLTASPFSLYSINSGSATNVVNITNIVNASVTNIVSTNAGTIYGETVLGGLSSNVTFNSAILAPTNIYTSQATASYSAFQNFMTLSSLAGLHIGDNIVFGVEQYVIIDITNWNNTIAVWPPARRTGSNENFIVYPNAEYHEDINGNPAGFVANDGSIGIVGLAGQNFNSGALYFLNGQYTTVLVGGADSIGGYFTVSSDYGGPYGEMFRVYGKALYDTLVVLPDNKIGGRVAVRGLTNMQGSTIPFYNSIQANYGGTFSSLVVTNAPTLQTTNAPPSNVTINGTQPDTWFTVTNNGIAYFVPGWMQH